MLNRLVRLRGGGNAGVGSGSPAVFVGAFGKHPAWHDHIHPAIGLEGRLTGVMEALYLGGIQKSIVAWREAAAADVVPFGHLFVWQTPSDVVVGRMWHSRDAANPPRTEYPMVVCAQCANVPAEWALTFVPEALERLGAACKAATKREAVEAAVDAAREEIRAAAAASRSVASSNTSATDPEAATARAVVALADDERVGPEGLRRVIYVLHEASPAHARHARVPGAADSDAAALRAWAQFLEARFGEGETRNLARVLIAPVGGEWVDLILGEPDAAHFRALRFSTRLAAPDTQTNYSMDEAFVRETDDFLARVRAVVEESGSERAPAEARPSGVGAASIAGRGAGNGAPGLDDHVPPASDPAAFEGPLLSPLGSVGMPDEVASQPKPVVGRAWKHLTIWIVLGIVLTLAVSILVIIGRGDPGAGTAGR